MILKELPYNKSMTIAQQLNVTTFPFIVKNKDGDKIYREDSDGYWAKHEYDAQGNIIRFENSNGYWCKREYDAHSNEIYYENSNGFWTKRELDTQGNEIRYENSYGYIKDNRPKIVELTLQDIADKLSINLEQLRIKD